MDYANDPVIPDRPSVVYSDSNVGRPSIGAVPPSAPVPPSSAPSLLPTPLGLMDPLAATPASAASTAFMVRAAVLPFRTSVLPPVARPVSFNDDLLLSSFRPSKLVWSGEQRRGIMMHISDAASIEDRVFKAIDQDFFLPKDIPLPGEIADALTFTMNTPLEIQVDFWREQLDRVQVLVDKAEEQQAFWYSQTPVTISHATGKFKFLAFTTLMDQYGLGGRNWMRQFVWGFPITGDLSQSGVYPKDPQAVPAPDTATIWADAESRFRSRAAGSGRLNEGTLWNESMEQVKKGWLSDPLPLGEDGQSPALGLGPINAAFRFGVSQSGKVRACDDLKYNRANEYCAVSTPVKLTTWDHIAQMAAIVRPTGCAWSFFKADHASAYKQLPLDPADRALAAVTLRDPATGRWNGFAPRSLLFGAVAAVLHYNAFSRALAKVFTRVTGIPLLSYFDDFGALAPLEVLEAALAAFVRFCEMLGIALKPEKTDMGPALTFLGVFGTFPAPGNDMSLSVELPREKAVAWGEAIDGFLPLGSIAHKELEGVIGRLSFTQTSVYGRVGRAMPTALYQKQNAKFYTPTLSGREASTLRWRRAALSSITPRLTRTRGPQTDLVVYTDAATTTMIIAAIIIEPTVFTQTRTLSVTLSLRVGKHWDRLFDATALIYGLEMLSIFAVLFDPAVDLRGRNKPFTWIIIMPWLPWSATPPAPPRSLL